MSSQLKIVLSTTGDLTEKNVSFTPSMVFVNNKSTSIFFPPTVKITSSLIRRAVPQAGKEIDVFTSRVYFTQFMKYATSKRRFKPISLAKAEEDGVVQSNFNFFKDIFFKRNNRIFIGSRGYSIISSKIDLSKSNIPKDSNNLTFKMHVNLNIIDSRNDTFVNRTRLSCKDKRANINDQWEAFFGQPFFDDGLPRNRTLKQQAPAMFTNDQGLAMGKAPTKLKKLTPMVPYAQPGFNPYQPQLPARGYPSPQQNPFYPIANAKPIANQGTQTGGKRKKTRRKRKKIKGTRRVKY